GALRALPEGLSKMFVHAYQSYIFNKSLSRYIEEDLIVERLPLVGFESRPDELTEKILAEEKVSAEDFRVKGFSQLSSKGELRDCFELMQDFKLDEIGKDELNGGANKVSLTFSLRPGVYATTLLREYMKNEYWL
ncbi:MAG: tRNA pseudouridine(13) synthase TruD, partial [Candidatus Altiarchaeales archaeon]|nr:tRNA pseudouridine(13) synthase TruD [Candidatus Altiarchaeales archaeon]